MIAHRAPISIGLAALVALGAATAGCGLVLGIKDVSGDGLGGSGGNGGNAGSGGAAPSTSSTSSTTTSSSSTGGGASTSSSSGGPAVCGDGVISTGETCEGADLGGKTCVDFGFVSPAGLTCKLCQLDPSTCTAACGNGKVEPGEECDGSDLNGHTCVEFGYVNPTGLNCQGCALNSGNCKSTCGNGKVEPGEECDDGDLNNNDGCSSNCKLEGVTCGKAIAVSINTGAPTTLMGTTAGAGAHTASACAASAGPDRVYAITPQKTGYLTVSLPRASTSFDSVLYITQNCSELSPNNALLCADSYDVQNNLPLNGGEVVSVRVQAGQTHYVFVDGKTAADSGTYQLNIDLSIGTDCNDPVPILLDPGAPMKVLGVTTSNNASSNSSAVGTCGGTTGGQIIYQVTRSTDGPLVASTDNMVTDYDAVLYARTSCSDQPSEIDCSSTTGASVPESITVPSANANVPFFVIVDGSGITGPGKANGNYQLTLKP
ncbi:MAG: myxococcus cysteine-rich repeat containing protein [Minicystis sp.]